MPEPKHLIIGGRLTLPLDIESLEALPINPGAVVQFDFVFHDIRFAIRYEEKTDHGAMRIVGDVGPMPFSAESPAARAGLQQIIAHANEVLDTLFRLNLGRVLLGSEIQIPRPVTATKLISTVALHLIPAIPYLDLIALYIRPPLAPAKRGESAVRKEWRHKPLPGPAKYTPPALTKR